MRHNIDDVALIWAGSSVEPTLSATSPPPPSFQPPPPPPPQMMLPLIWAGSSVEPTLFARGPVLERDAAMADAANFINSVLFINSEQFY